jgi:hypothetical protein
MLGGASASEAFEINLRLCGVSVDGYTPAFQAGIAGFEPLTPLLGITSWVSKFV